MREKWRFWAARNRVIEVAVGDFIAYLDSDDEWLQGKLDRQLSAFANSDLDNVGVVMCGFLPEEHAIRNANPKLPKYRGWMFKDLLAQRAQLGRPQLCPLSQRSRGRSR